jgi:hypothetical protein
LPIFLTPAHARNSASVLRKRFTSLLYSPILAPKVLHFRAEIALYGFFRTGSFNRAVLVSSDGDRALLAISDALDQPWCPASVRGPGVYAYGRQHTIMAGIYEESIGYDDARERW